jgi:hypothetical protein
MADVSLGLLDLCWALLGKRWGKRSGTIDRIERQRGDYGRRALLDSGGWLWKQRPKPYHELKETDWAQLVGR